MISVFHLLEIGESKFKGFRMPLLIFFQSIEGQSHNQKIMCKTYLAETIACNLQVMVTLRSGTVDPFN
jgi:hypothetical protein